MFRKTGVPTALAILAAIGFFWAARASGQPQDPKGLGFKKRFVIEIRNPSVLPLENHPVVLNVNEIRAFAPDFNSYNYAIFDETGGGYRLVVSQADDLDQDRVHDEIVLERSLPASSTTTLACYYSPKGSFQLMVSTPKAFARLSGTAGNISAAWESNLAAFKFINGHTEVYGKLYAGLILKKVPADEGKLQEWGLNLLAGDSTPGLGEIGLWDGKTSLPLAGAGQGIGSPARPRVVSAGPLRALVKVEYPATGSGRPESGTVVFYSAFADNVFSRQDVIGPKTGGPLIYGVSVRKLAAEEAGLDKDKGTLATWGRGPGAAGEMGLAALFAPSDFAGLDETGPARTVRLNAKPGKRLTFWTLGGWERGVVTVRPPAGKNWAALAADLGLRLRVPVEVRFKVG